MDNKKTGQYISALRKEKNLTQQQLAELLGVTNKAVSKWETGEGMPDISLLAPLAETLNTTTDAILNGEERNEAEKEPLEHTLSYAVEKEIHEFRFTCYFVYGLAGFAFLVFGIMWYELQNAFAMLGGGAIIFASFLIFFLTASHFNHKWKMTAQQHPTFQMPVSPYKKSLRIALLLWLFLPCLWAGMLLPQNLPIAYPRFWGLLFAFGIYAIIVFIIFYATREKSSGK